MESTSSYTIDISPESPNWITKETAQERYSLSEKKLKKWGWKYVGRRFYGDHMRYWEPDIQNMLECKRTGKRARRSPLTYIFSYYYPLTWDPIPFNNPRALPTLCILACWTVMPVCGFYQAGFTFLNILLLLTGIGLIFITREYYLDIYFYVKKKWRKLKGR